LHSRIEASWLALKPVPFTVMTSPAASLLQVAPVQVPVADVVTLRVIAGVAAPAIMDVPRRSPPVKIAARPTNPSLEVSFTRRASTYSPPMHRFDVRESRGWGLAPPPGSRCYWYCYRYFPCR